VSDGAVAEYGAAAARALSYMATALLLGAATIGVVMQDDDRPRDLARRLHWIGVAAALVLLAAQAAKLWEQGASLADPDTPVTAQVLATFAFSTVWGGRWQIQCLLAIAALAAFAISGRARLLMILRATAAGLTAFSVPLTGHAAAHPAQFVSALGSQGLHVLAGGVWFGTLTTLLSARVDSLRLWQRFSAIAQTCAPIVILTGLFRVYQNIAELSDLWQTGWGRTLLLKITVVLLAGAVGLLNWRVWLPGAARQEKVTLSLRRAVLLELTFAGAVFILTGWLSGLPRRMS
jgi:copper transport protein